MSRLLILLIALSLVVAACDGDEQALDEGTDPEATPTAEAEDEDEDELTERLDALEQEVEELRAQLETIAESDVEDRLESLDGRLVGLAERVDSVDASLDEETAARASTIAELRALTGDLQDAVAALRSTAQGIRRDLNEVTDDHYLLREQFEHHRSQGSH